MNVRLIIVNGFAVCICLGANPRNVSGQIFVAGDASNSVSEYDTNGGPIHVPLFTLPAAVNDTDGAVGVAVSGPLVFASGITSNSVYGYDITSGTGGTLVTGLSGPRGIAVFGGDLFVANHAGDTVGEYNATTGATVNVIPVSEPWGLALSGGTLYVTSNVDIPNVSHTSTIEEFNATTGALINPALVTFGSPGTLEGIAVSGSNLYVVQTSTGTVQEYDATTGAPINTSFITGISSPNGIAVSGGKLFVTSNMAGLTNQIGEYDAATGAPINPSLIQALGAVDVAVVSDIAAVPEPATWAIGFLAVITILGSKMRRRPLTAVEERVS
jgi:WD40 repeat protein